MCPFIPGMGSASADFILRPVNSNIFCLKACDPSGSNDARYCEHIYDTQGCGFNAPSNARNNVFESCASDNQPFPGAGVAVPASSLCSTFASTDIYGPSATVRVPIPGASTISFSPIPRPTPTATTTSTPTSTPAETKTGADADAAQQTDGSNAAVAGFVVPQTLVASVVSAMLGLAILF
jgi:hypothetical protein